MKIRFTLLALAITLSLTAAAPEPDFRAMYAGIYNVQIDGQPSSGTVETYFLSPDGRADWVYASAVDSSCKTGRWYAVKGIININIAAQTGTIAETFKLAPDGKWRNGPRYLKIK